MELDFPPRNNWRNTRNQADSMARYGGGLPAMGYSETTGYVSCSPARGWDGRINTLRKFDRMKRQLVRVITFSQYPAF